MLLWVIFAVMAAAAAIALLRPLTVRREPLAMRPQYEAAVYKEQLRNIERDVETGALSPGEAEGARAEIGRRLLAASEAGTAPDPSPTNASSPKIAAIGVMIFVPLVSLGLYAANGAPGIPSAPAASRGGEAIEDQSVDQLIARVESHLRDNPTDARGWEVLGPALMRLGRFDGAARAFRRVIDIEGPNAQRLARWGEAQMFAGGGIVNATARDAFAQAAELDPTLPDPRFYLGMASLQDGDRDTAVSIWRDLLADAPESASWREAVEAQIARATGGEAGGAPGEENARYGIAASGEAPSAMPGPTAADVAAAGNMSAEDRQAMIAGMVEGLDARLSADGGTAEEWLRLANAYRVMGEDEKREETIDRARQALKTDAEALARFEAGVSAGQEG